MRRLHEAQQREIGTLPWNDRGRPFNRAPAASAYPYWIVEGGEFRLRISAPDGMLAREMFERDHPGVPVTCIAKEIYRRY